MAMEPISGQMATLIREISMMGRDQGRGVCIIRMGLFMKGRSKMIRNMGRGNKSMLTESIFRDNFEMVRRPKGRCMPKMVLFCLKSRHDIFPTFLSRSIDLIR